MPDTERKETKQGSDARGDAVVALLCAAGAFFLGPLTGLPAIRIGSRARRALPPGHPLRVAALLSVGIGWLSVVIVLGILVWLALDLRRPAQTLRQFEERRVLP